MDVVTLVTAERRTTPAQNHNDHGTQPALGTDQNWEEDILGCTDPVHGPYQMDCLHDRMAGFEQSTAGRASFDAPT